MDTDNQLLGSYAKTGSERAFRELVERRINLVHSAALRESGGDSSFAEDITQAVFTELARNARALAGHPALSGWLYTCVHRMSTSVRRSEQRRHRREQEAFIMNQLLSSDPADNLWKQVRPLLDGVMHELSDEDRTAIVLRFFEDRSLKEVGLALGLTENAARMRVERSLERIRGSLSKRGVNSTASTLAAVLTTGAVITAPASLASTVATGALTAAALSGVFTFTLARLLESTKADGHSGHFSGIGCRGVHRAAVPVESSHAYPDKVVYFQNGRSCHSSRPAGGRCPGRSPNERTFLASNDFADTGNGDRESDGQY